MFYFIYLVTFPPFFQVTHFLSSSGSTSGLSIRPSPHVSHLCVIFFFVLPVRVSLVRPSTAGVSVRTFSVLPVQYLEPWRVLTDNILCFNRQIMFVSLYNYFFFYVLVMILLLHGTALLLQTTVQATRWNVVRVLALHCSSRPQRWKLDRSGVNKLCYS